MNRLLVAVGAVAFVWLVSIIVLAIFMEPENDDDIRPPLT